MSEREIPEDVLREIQNSERRTIIDRVAKEINRSENRLDPELRSNVDEVRNNLHSIVTDLELLVQQNGEEFLAKEAGKTRIVQAKHYINQLNSLLGGKERAKALIEDTLSTISNSTLYRALRG